MASEKTPGTSIVTPEFRISYPKVFKPEVNSLSKKLEYSIEAIFKKGEDLTALKNAYIAVATKEFGPDQKKWPKFKNNPFRKQDEKAKDGKLPAGLTAGAIFMRFKCDAEKHKPGVVDQQNQPIIEPSKFYAGGYARASVSAFAYNQAGNAGVSFSLNHLQFVKDGEPFSSRPSVESAFEPIEIEETEHEETAEDLL